MANEISYSATLSAAKGSTQVNSGAMNGLITMAGTDMLAATQTIGVTEEVLNFGDITGAPAAVLVKNLDPTNFVQLSATGQTGFVIKLLAGQTCLFQPSAASVYAKADASPVSVWVVAVES